MQHLCFPEAKCVHMMWRCQSFQFARVVEMMERLHSESDCVWTCCEIGGGCAKPKANQEGECLSASEEVRLLTGSQAQRPLLQVPSISHPAMPQQAIPLHVLAEIQRAMAHASVVAKQAGGVALSPNDIFMQGEQSPYHSFALLSRYKLVWQHALNADSC